MAASAAKNSASNSKDYYYEKDPLTNKEGNGENLTWGGKGAEELGLDGAVNKEDFENIMSQKDQEGNELRNTTNSTGEKVDTLDVVFAAPKSMSLLAFGGEGNEKIIDIHEAAVQKAMDYLEDNHANIKKGSGDDRQLENQGNLTYATALHSGARGDKLSDPHLHSHNVISNMVKDNETGEHKALAMKPLMDNLKVADQIYKSEMAKGLVNEGYQLEDKKHGWDIKMDQEVIDTFSSRSKEITGQVMEKFSKDKDPMEVAEAVINSYEKTTGKSAEGLSVEKMVEEGGTAGNQKEFLTGVAEELGETYSQKDKYHAQHAFKDDKKKWNPEDLKEAWEDKLQQDTGVRSFADLDKEAKGEMDFKFSSEKEVLEKTMELLTQNEAVIEEKQLLKEASSIATGQFSYMDLKEELDNVKKIGQTEGQELKRVDDTAYTTKEMHTIEKENVDMIKNAGKSEALLTPEQAKAGLKDFEDNNYKLKDGQYEAAYNALTTEDNIVTIQGVAGAGKTASLKAINHALDHNDKQVDVTLLAPTNKAVGGAIEESKLENGKEFSGMTNAKYVNQANKELEGGNTKDSIKNDTEKKTDKKEDYKSEKAAEKGFNKEAKEAEKQVKQTKSGGLNYGITKSDSKSQAEVFVKTGNKPFDKASKHTADFQKNNNGDWQTSRKTANGKGRVSTMKSGEFKGATKTEDWSKKDTYKVDIKYKDGSRFKSETKSYGQIDRSSAKNAAGSMVGKFISSGHTKATANSKGEKSIEKSNTLMGMTLETKNAKNEYGHNQSKIAFDVLKVAKLEKNVVEKSGKNSNKVETTYGASAFGFSAKTTKEEVFNKKGELTSLNTIKEKTFAGFTLSKEVKVASEEDLNKLNGKADIKIELKKNDNGKETNEKLEVTNIDSKKAVAVAEENTKLAKTDKVVIMDEGSMTGAKDMNTMLKMQKEVGGKLFIQGDSEQLQSISAGKAFDQLKENGKTVEMNESVRQQNTSEKKIADNIRDKDTVKESFKELKSSGKLHEIKDEAKRVDAIASAAVKKETLSGTKPNGEDFTKKIDYKNNIALSNTNRENELVNSAIRDKLHKSGEINKNDHVKAETLQTKNMSGVKQMKADNFEKGQVISTFDKGIGIKTNTNYEIVSKNTKDNTLMLKTKNEKTGKNDFRKVDLKAAAGKLQVSEKKDKEFSKGDIIVVNKTDKDAKLMNSDRGEVVSIDKDKKSMKVDFGDKGVKDIDMSKGDKGVDHGYSVTNYKAQGISVDRVQSNVNTEQGTNLNATHVAMTRQKLKSEMFTDNAAKAESQSKVKQEKTSTIDYVERKAEKAQAAKTEKVEVKEASKEVKDKVQEAKNEAGGDKREGRKLNFNEVKEAVQKSGEERNEGKRSGDNDQYRSGQESFMNNQVVARGGFDKEAVQNYADKAVETGKMHSKDADQFVVNAEKHAESLKNVGILEDKGNGKMAFTDSKSKEILFDNADKGIDKIGEENAKAYKEVGKEKSVEKIDTKEDTQVKLEGKVEAKVEDIKKDTTIETKVENVKSDSKVEVKSQDIKEDTNIKTESKNVDKDITVKTEAGNIREDKPVEAKIEDIKGESKVEAPVESVKNDSKVEAKVEDIREGSKVEASVKDLKSDSGFEDKKGNDKVETTVENVKENSKVETTVENVEKGSNVEVKSDSVDKDSTVKTEAKNVDPEAKVETENVNVKNSSEVEVKSQDIKEDIKIETSSDNVKADSSVETKVENVDKDTTVKTDSENVDNSSKNNEVKSENETKSDNVEKQNQGIDIPENKEENSSEKEGERVR